MKLYYTMQVVDEDTDLEVARIGSYSEESLLEESGKSKWTDMIKAYIEEAESAVEENPVYPDDNEDEMSEEEARRIEIESHIHP